MEYDYVLSENIRQLRIEKGIEQSQFAIKIGVTKQALNNYEQHLRKVPVNLVPVIADELGVSIDRLFGRGE